MSTIEFWLRRKPYNLIRSGNDRYLKQLSKLLEVLVEISENNEKNNGNYKSGGAEDQIISYKHILLPPDNENKTQ